MFAELSDKLSAALAKLRGRGVLTEEAVREGLEELRRALLEPSAAIAGGLATAQPWLVSGFALVLLGFTGWNLARSVGPPYYYQLGWKAFEKGDYPGAIPYFQRAITLGGETPTAGDGTFFRAASLLRMNRSAEAMAGYQGVITGFPESIWVAESHYHVGLCLQQLGRLRAAKASWRYVAVNYPGNRWAGFANDRLRELRAARRAQRPHV